MAAIKNYTDSQENLRKVISEEDPKTLTDSFNKMVYQVTEYVPPPLSKEERQREANMSKH